MSKMTNVIKVLCVINFGPKCNKSPNGSRISIGPKLDKVTVTEIRSGLIM